MNSQQEAVAAAGRTSGDVQYVAVEEVMSTRVVSIGVMQTVTFALALMDWCGLRHLPVVDNDKLVGLVSERDLLFEIGPDPSDEAAATPVGRIMICGPETVDPREDLRMAAARMAVRAIGCLPVVQGKKVIGMLTQSDVVAFHGGLFFKNSNPAALPDVATVMQRDVVTVTQDDTLLHATALMEGLTIRHLPVIDADRRVVGMVSDRDIRDLIGPPGEALTTDEFMVTRLTGRTVAEALTPNPICAYPETSIFELVDRFVRDRIGAIVVIDPESERLVGIASYIDVLSHLVGPDPLAGPAAC